MKANTKTATEATPKSRYTELKQMLEERRREIQAEVQGKMRDAMMTARRTLLEHPTADNSSAVLEMARVFKAADLNLVHANAFLQYFQAGKGANPLDDFFKQFPAQAADGK